MIGHILINIHTYIHTMLPGQMKQQQLESVVDVPRALSLEFDPNRVNNS